MPPEARTLESVLMLVFGVIRIIEVIPGFMKDAIGDAFNSGKQGHPRAPYVLPAAELLTLSLRLTGQPPVTTTKKAGNEFISPSTEFVRLCLTMIKPEIKMAEVATSITRAFNAIDRMFEMVGNDAIPSEELWRRLEQVVVERKVEKVRP
jgi:hypothetical protein